MFKNNRVTPFLAVSFALSLAAAADAHLGITVCRGVDGRLVTGHGDYQGTELHVPERVFEGGFEETLTSHSPGFNAQETADAMPEGYAILPARTPLRFDPFAFTLPEGKTNLGFWDGNADVAFSPVAGGTTLTVEQHSSGLSAVLTGSDGGAAGFDFAVTSAAGGLHEHLLFSLGSSTGSPAEGIYLWSFVLSMPGMETSEPLFILHETPFAPLTLDLAVSWVEDHLDTLVPAVLPGDANGDGFVSSADLDIVRANWGQSGTPGKLPGDLDTDGAVNSADLDIVRANWGRGSQTSGPEGVPEPAGLGLLLIAGAMLGLNGRFRQRS